MPNNTAEQNLVNEFVEKVQNGYGGVSIHNQGVTSRSFADIELTLPDGQRWAIEAKSHESPTNRSNTVHQIFGNLMRETGRGNRENCEIGVLIPEGGANFYKCRFQNIKREKFVCFGLLIPVNSVFTYDRNGVKYTPWAEFYDRGFEGCRRGFPPVQ